jgi:hypothetical protein
MCREEDSVVTLIGQLAGFKFVRCDGFFNCSREECTLFPSSTIMSGQLYATRSIDVKEICVVILLDHGNFEIKSTV